MNNQGRHYRDQYDVTNPMCDYVSSNGVSCDFFSSGHEHSNIPYPTDVSLGPVAAGPDHDQPGEETSLATILKLLTEQKAASERQGSQLQLLQHQVNSWAPTTSTSTVAVSTASVSYSTPVAAHSTTTTPSPYVQSMSAQPYGYAPRLPAQPPYPTPLPVTTNTPPHVLQTAASQLASHLQSGLGHQHNFGYNGLTMDQLRSNPGVVSEANRLLATTTSAVPPLNPLEGMGMDLGRLGAHRQGQVTSVDQLYAATTVNKQLRAYEFAATGQFPYKSQLKQDNCNAICFAYGSFKHLKAAKLGLVHMSNTEFNARLKHLENVFEVACLSSNLAAFTDPAWQVAREYDSRVISDIESGVKTWDSLCNGLETDAIYCAKETVELKNKTKKPKDPKDPKDKKRELKDPKNNKSCTTYNTHRASEGCYWEHNNKGETCVFEHFCSWCYSNREVKEKHKLIHCTYKTE